MPLSDTNSTSKVHSEPLELKGKQREQKKEVVPLTDISQEEEQKRISSPEYVEVKEDIKRRISVFEQEMEKLIYRFNGGVIDTKEITAMFGRF